MKGSGVYSKAGLFACSSSGRSILIFHSHAATVGGHGGVVNNGSPFCLLTGCPGPVESQLSPALGNVRVLG